MIQKYVLETNSNQKRALIQPIMDKQKMRLEKTQQPKRNQVGM